MTRVFPRHKAITIYGLFDLEELCGRPGGGYGPWARVGGLPPGKTDPERGFKTVFSRICSPKFRDSFFALAGAATANFPKSVRTQGHILREMTSHGALKTISPYCIAMGHTAYR